MKIALATCHDLPGWEVDDKPLHKALKALGATVHTPIWNDEVDWEQFDITVIRTTWDYHANQIEFVDWCRKVPRLFNNATVVAWNTHKSYLRELSSGGATIAPTSWISAGKASTLIFLKSCTRLKPQKDLSNLKLAHVPQTPFVLHLKTSKKHKHFSMHNSIKT